jgi:hypothetical protein
LTTPKSSLDPTFPARFFARGTLDAHGCINWTGAQNNNGRGYLKFDGKRHVTAQRVAWQLVNGPIPEGMFVAHICRNPLCIRTAHLTLLTKAELDARHQMDLAAAQLQPALVAAPSETYQQAVLA